MSTDNEWVYGKMECRWCNKTVNIPTEKAVVRGVSKGMFFVYCERCWSGIEEANDEDYLNGIFD